ncbi:hypothetical protein [Nonomuraea turcica]|nr:hypothetical protein [Nonomuraea sp. G32]MDP4512138.1 hypothetical protein [Nonomuraea sp. G32]
MNINEVAAVLSTLDARGHIPLTHPSQARNQIPLAETSGSKAAGDR